MVELVGRYSNQTDVLVRLQKLLALPEETLPRKLRKPRQKQVHLNKEGEAQLVEAYHQLGSVKAVASKFGVHRTTASAILERHGIKRHYRLLDSRQVAKAKRLYELGLSLEDVGQVLSTDPKTVRNALLKAGVTMRPVGTNQWK